MLKRFLLGVVFVCVLAAAGFLYISYAIDHSRGENTDSQVIQIKKGDNVFDVAKTLDDANVIASKWYFVALILEKKLHHSLVAGEYELSGAQSLSDIADTVTKGEVVKQGVTVVFPEGWDIKKMAERLESNDLPGDEFLALAMHPKEEWRNQFLFLKGIPKNASLEGFLFPDTYTFPSNATADTIIVAMLKNFDKKWGSVTAKDLAIVGQKSVFDIVTFASIVENEVTSSADRKLVADIFWKRLSIGQPLQSDATVKYILGKNKIQHSIEETRVDSPYNTYIYKGLPPGPISNPGLDALLSAVSPTPNPYYYFLSDADTGETVFSITFEEHVENKQKHGL